MSHGTIVTLIDVEKGRPKAVAHTDDPAHAVVFELETIAIARELAPLRWNGRSAAPVDATTAQRSSD